MTPRTMTASTTATATSGSQGGTKEDAYTQETMKEGETPGASPNLHFDQHNEGNRRNLSVAQPSLPVYSAQSYLRYQGDKFIRRFDANCYLSLTRMLDTHDVSRGRGEYPDALGAIGQSTLIIGMAFTLRADYSLKAIH